MTLVLILISLVCFSLIANLLPKYSKIFILISILIVFSFYFFLSKNFFNVEAFYPKSNIQLYMPLSNYYNLLLKSLKNHKLYIADDKDFPLLKDPNIYENYKNYAIEDDSMFSLLDTSYYKGKIYLYFGITPVLLFYAPFYFCTKLYLTDKFLVFILSCFIFLISLFLTKKIYKSIESVKTVPLNIVIISIFFIGFCNYLLFLLVKSNTYEVAMATAMFLLLLSFCLLYYYINTQSTKKQIILNFCLSLTLCLTVGARPHYVLFIPVFFFIIVGLKYKENKNIKDTIISILIFMIPCLIYGVIIALYNNLRFDSFFNFGFKYQLNDLNLMNDNYSYVKDFYIAMKYSLLQNLNTGGDTFFSLTKCIGHSRSNEFSVGIIWTFPLIFLFLIFPKFLLEVFKKNKNTFYIIILMLFIISVNIFITSFTGIVIRYFFEYMSFCVILAIILFCYLYNNVTSNHLKQIFNICFILIFVYSVFINISLLFCENNSLFYASTSNDNYVNIVNFLFR